ncbi:Cytochrome P450 [Operophtera brumata]|uniref:unspecific monooxygenase n=1 Tax=Operophtera brumata TaxID=104452 RepID=A0A0L7LRY0_OPEBR|nr:Cytochrome P450 [Operophtera brumata]
MAVMLAIWFIIALVLTLYYLSTKTFNYWKKKKVPYHKPVPLFGNYAKHIQMRQHAGKICQKLCAEFRDEPYFGTFYGTDPALVILDPEVIKLVLIKDFYYFNSRGAMHYNDSEMLMQNLFFSHGDKWKIARQNLTPLFSSAKMKNMFYLIQRCAYIFEDMLEYETGISDVIEAKTLMIRYTMDCICSCAFGINANTQTRDAEKNIFTIMGHNIFGHSYKRAFTTIARSVWPEIFYMLGMKSFSISVNAFFYNLLTGVFESRQNKPSPRNDFVDLVLSWKTNKHLVGESISNMKTGGFTKIKQEVDNELLVSQCVIFFAAGFETSASVLSLTIYELAKNQEVQRRAQKEVDEYLLRHRNKLTYDCVKELPYINACVAETSRLYPALGILTRQAVEDYTFPCGLHLERGSRVHLPIYYLHHNADNFLEPEEYKPERFLPGAKHEIKQFTYFPFGEGPRTCIGTRFAKMQITPGLIAFLKKYSVELAEGTPSTLEFDPSFMQIIATTPLRLKVTLRSGWEDRVFVRESSG